MVILTWITVVILELIHAPKPDFLEGLCLLVTKQVVMQREVRGDPGRHHRRAQARGKHISIHMIIVIIIIIFSINCLYCYLYVYYYYYYYCYSLQLMLQLMLQLLLLLLLLSTLVVLLSILSPHHYY